jgi:hypothetical protein
MFSGQHGKINADMSIMVNDRVRAPRKNCWVKIFQRFFTSKTIGEETELKHCFSKLSNKVTILNSLSLVS